MGLELRGFENMPHVEEEVSVGIIERLRLDDSLDIPPLLADADLWANFASDDLYEIDKAVRKWIKATFSQRQKKGGIRTAVPLVFMAIFGRAPEPSDSATCRMLHRVLSYYAIKSTGSSKINKVRFAKTYTISKHALKSKRSRRPLSIKLRLEENPNASLIPYRLPGDHQADR